MDRLSSEGLVLPTTPLSSTPTATAALPTRAGRFTVDGRSSSDRLEDFRQSEAFNPDPNDSAGGSIALGSITPAEHSPVRFGRFAVASKDAELQDVIRRNMQANYSKKSIVVQDTLSLLTSQIQSLVDRVAYLEAENARLTSRLSFENKTLDPRGIGQRSASLHSETST